MMDWDGFQIELYKSAIPKTYEHCFYNNTLRGQFLLWGPMAGWPPLVFIHVDENMVRITYRGPEGGASVKISEYERSEEEAMALIRSILAEGKSKHYVSEVSWKDMEGIIDGVMNADVD